MPQRPPLLDLPGSRLGERGRLRVLESEGCDPERLYNRILNGRYRKPFIVDDGQTRRLYFSLRFVQSSMRLDDPFALDFAYTRKMMAFLLFAPDPRRVLLVGLGGGSLAKFCHRYLPRTHLTVVEVSPDVIALRGEFNIPEDARLEIVQADAAKYLPRAEADTDVLLLDGFDDEGIAPSFLSRKFYVAARRRLGPGGLLVANFCGPPERWHRHMRLLDWVFEGRVYIARVRYGDNYVAFAFADEGFPLDWARLEQRAGALAGLVPLDFPELLERLREGGELRSGRGRNRPT
ncbi:spermidine synthase [Thiocystis violacea]|uniref:spermine/spermidine synthase domain-containing protein n=1 Tax=Thiocystis violacea TaxID=13725 RepID=UPI001F5B53F7|nr:spermidine synthase [Thiocystis violacea]